MEASPISTYTNTNTYTRTRIGVINDHFQLFLKCAGMSNTDIEKLLEAADRKELEAVGIYIEDGGFRIAEVEFRIDWDEHQRMIGLYGAYSNTDQPGWENGVAPEAYMAAQNLVKLARNMNKNVCSWIIVSDKVRSDSTMYKTVCDRLGYGGGTVPSWKTKPIEQGRNIHYLKEAKVIQRLSR